MKNSAKIVCPTFRCRQAWILVAFALLANCSKVVDAPVAGAGAGEVRFDKINVRNFDQMNQTMSALTGVSSALVASKFSSDPSSGIRASLPNDNSIKAFNASHQGAIIKLASFYCDEFVKVIKKPDQVALSNFIFPKTLAELNSAKVAEVSSKFYDKFWAACSNKPELSEVQSEISSLVSDLGELETVDSYVGIMCTVFMSSSCVSMY